MTPLAGLLARRIAATGPITVADYMADCLLHPEHGYYMHADPLGTAGDFTTAPEISQMFGELLGLCLTRTWAAQGGPSFTLTELGPGRGTLMADLLRAARLTPGFTDAASLHLIESSTTLRKAQAATLAPTTPTWHARVEDLPEAPLFLVANEFFDALPIRQFQRDPAGWRERHVALAEHDALSWNRRSPGHQAGTSPPSNPKPGRDWPTASQTHHLPLATDTLTLALSDPAPVAALDHRLADTAPGDIVETRPAADAIVSEIARRIATHGGAALILDYGDWRSRGDTFQAVRHHAPEDPLAAPGAADLTGHVDFEALAAAATAAGAAVTEMTPQGVFLERLGITQRARALAQNLTGAALDTHIAAHRRLTHPEEMGTLFKVLALYPPGTAPPPGAAP